MKGKLRFRKRKGGREQEEKLKLDKRGIGRLLTRIPI